jgi:hypothetical protein
LKAEEFAALKGVLGEKSQVCSSTWWSAIVSSQVYKMVKANELLKAYHASVAAGLTVGSFSGTC